MTDEVSNLSVEDALSMAIQAEIDAAGVYSALKDKVNNFVLREKIFFLIGEEEKHRRILTALFEKLFSGQKPEAGVSVVPDFSIVASENETVPDLLKQAMAVELRFEVFYTQLVERMDERGAQEILKHLAAMERGHYDLLKTEHELCLKDEQYYDRGDFEYDMVHIGP